MVARENRASWRVLEHAGFELLEEAERTLHGRLGLVRTYARRTAERRCALDYPP